MTSSKAEKVYPHTAEDAARRDGHKLLAVCDLPHDPHLQVVLCEIVNDEKWVVWWFNKESGGFGSGDYCRNILEAAFAYTLRCLLGGGEPGNRLPSKDEIKAADEQLFPRGQGEQP